MKYALLLCLVISFPSFAGVFKSLDADGNTIYTDIAPQKDAKEIVLPEINVTAPQENKSAQQAPTPKKDKATQRVYDTLKIISPSPDQGLRENSGTVNIKVQLSPSLAATMGDQLIITVDGTQVNEKNSTSVNLSNVDRGTHTITASISNPNNKNIAKSTSSTFHLIRYIPKTKEITVDTSEQ